MVGKGKGSCFDKPGPNYKYVADMREDAQRRAAASDLTKDAREQAILKMVEALSGRAKDRFRLDVRDALRRAKDGAAATPCSGWARRCEKCRTGSVGQSHRVWCENRDTFKRKEEKELADKLQLEIEAYQAWYAENGASDAAGPSGLPLLLPERVLPLADAPVTTTTTTAATTTATTATTIGVGAAATAVVRAVSSSLVASTELGKRNAALLHAADKSDFRCLARTALPCSPQHLNKPLTPYSPPDFRCAGQDPYVYRADINFAATRESAWMRKEVSVALAKTVAVAVAVDVAVAVALAVAIAVAVAVAVAVAGAEIPL